MTSDARRIGCAGAGLLGGAIMRRLIERGFEVKVWNRTRAKLAEVIEAGATAVDTPADLARDTDFVLLCLTDGAAVETVTFGDGGIADAAGPDTLVIDMSTISGDETRDIAGRLRETRGGRWLDAPISGGPPAALEGRMAVMVGGAQEDFAQAGPVFDALAGRATLMGPTGAGQATKLINQVLVACGFAIVAEACGLAERAGVDAARVPEALAGGRADSSLLQEYMARMTASDFSPGGTIAVMMKDLRMINALATATDTPTPMTAAATGLYRKFLLDGDGECDNMELVRYYRPAG